MTKCPVVCGWSGGKDSAMMLHRLMQSSEYSPQVLLTTVTETFGRISMHGVRRELLHAQARATGLRLQEVMIPWPCPNEVYEQRMREACLQLREQGFDTFAFGDLFLEDVRAYRENNLATLGLKGIYPLWGEDTAKLARYFIEEGFRATLCCVDTRQIPGDWAGREYDEALLSELPVSADPCGENGEFHSFTWAGPVFREPMPCTKGEVVIVDGFAYCDLIPEKPQEKLSA